VSRLQPLLAIRDWLLVLVKTQNSKLKTQNSKLKTLSDIAIRIENLSKSYMISHDRGVRATNLREALGQRLRKPFARSTSETFWALKGIDLEIKRGEVVGVIGRNGAGKSTLLKILSRITEPTTGRIELYGRVGALLEVGTGFHPELTGRENVYLNGAILGMRESEINRQFDAIVDFAGVEKFLDTPVKRYSSGMSVRLGFAVAAHLEPEILIVDEVLAVGDAEFQAKCLGKMKDVAGQGRTVLFVSHNMAAVRTLCSNGVVIDGGQVAYRGPTENAIAGYLGNALTPHDIATKATDREGDGKIRVVGLSLANNKGEIINKLMSGQLAQIQIDYEVKADENVERVIASVQCFTASGTPVFLQHNYFYNVEFGKLSGEGTFFCEFERFPLPAGQYFLSISLMAGGGSSYSYHDRIENAMPFTVIAGTFFPNGVAPGQTHATCLVDANWSVVERNPNN
jgi:lipopolysaccharide transport system ATP-binding protein